MLASGRKSEISVADAIVKYLGQSGTGGSSLADITKSISECVGYEVPSATVRSTIYRHTEVFERVGMVDGKTFYRLSRRKDET